MRKKITGDNLTLESVAAMFAHWRGNRAKREAIPPHLWNAAVRLCQTHPITHVCSHLRLSFATLKEHMVVERSSDQKFVELSFDGFSSGWRIECDRPDVGKLTISGRQSPPPVEAALRAFLS